MIRRCGLLGTAAVLVLFVPSCGESSTGQGARSPKTSVPRASAPSSTTLTPVTTTPYEFGHVGGTLSVSIPREAEGTPGTPDFNVTLNQVIDPALPQVPNHPAPQDARYVEMNVTIANVGSATLSPQYGYLPHQLGFTWYLNPSHSVVDTGEAFTQDFPSATCHGVPQDVTQDEVAPGQSITGCVQFGPISDSIAVTGFEASLSYSGFTQDSYPAVWEIS
jgi:hypothetical protein